MGLDENLPCFHLADPKDQYKTSIPYLLTRGGNDPEPAYTLQRPDPSSPNAQNCYAAALFDAYSPDILYGEVLIRPRWTPPTLSSEEIRRNGGIPPPPEPALPTSFTVQLYNPDLQIEVQREQSTFGGTHYDFAMSQDTFRLPSTSALDRSQHDPAASITTPKVTFSFKREGRMSKDMTLYMTGRSTDVVHKKKKKEPDISIAMFKALRECTMYEPNLRRLDMEDPKGLEVTILLIATVIKDVYYSNLRTAFNVTDESARRRNSNPRKGSDPSNHLRKERRPSELRKQPSALMSGALGGVPPEQPHHSHSTALPPGASGLYAHPASTSNIPARLPRQSDPEPITDPKTQWQIDAETARLKQQADAERAAEEQRRREKARRDEAESRRLSKQVEAEERERKRREREVQKETERLQRIYGSQGGVASAGGAATAPVPQGAFPRPPQGQKQNYPSYPQQGSSQVYVPQQQFQRPPPQQQRPSQGQGQSQVNLGMAGLFPQSGGGAFAAGQSVGNLLGMGAGKKVHKKRSSVW